MMESKNRIAKAQIVDKCFNLIKGKSLVVLNNKKLSANEINSLRKSGRSVGVCISVFKNRLAAIALKKHKVAEEFLKQLKNKTMFLICDDVVDGAGIMKVAQKNNFEFVGYIENSIYESNPEAISALADYGTAKQACGSYLAALQDPIRQIAKIFEIISSE